ncbi:MAG: amidohydrolase [Candidatus Zixiibacteriota bacterium]
MKKLFKNAKFYTMRDKNGDFLADFDEFFNSMVTKDGKIEKVDNDIEGESFDEIIDLDGKTALPSFTDSHVHFFQSGFLLDGADFSNVFDQDELLSLIASSIEGRRFFQSWGYDPARVSDDAELPTKEMLDKIDSEIPIFIRRKDGHSSAVNSASIKLLSENLDNFRLENDKGHLYDSNHLDAERYFLGLAGEEELHRAIEAVEKEALTVGATSIHSLVHRKDWARILMNARTKIETNIYLESWNPVDAAEIGLNRVGGCLLLDGSFGSHTAALSFPYKDRPDWQGKLYRTDRDLINFLETAQNTNLQTSVHSIGDRSTMQMLEIHEKFPDIFFRNLRHRIEHAELQSNEHLALAKKLNIVYAMQPAFELYWGGLDNMYGERLGKMALSTNRYRSILAEGIVIAGGSDSYITPIDPLLGIHAACNHPNEMEALEIGPAIRMFSFGGPYAVSQEGSLGTLEEGKKASFVILDNDPFETDKKAIKDIDVLQTFIKGESAYRKGDAND